MRSGRHPWTSAGALPETMQGYALGWLLLLLEVTASAEAQYVLSCQLLQPSAFIGRDAVGAMVVSSNNMLPAHRERLPTDTCERTPRYLFVNRA